MPKEELLIRFSNGHTAEYFAASGALAFDGSGWPWEKPLIWSGLMDPRLFTVRAKTLTFLRRRGNLRWYAPWRCIRLIPDGVVNAVGLTNMGFIHWCLTVGPKINRSQLAIIASINQEENIESTGIEAILLDGFDLVGVELNISCPNVSHGDDVQKFEDRAVEACRILRKRCRHPLLVKLSVTHRMDFVRRLAPYAEAFDINSVPWDMVFPGQTSPLEKTVGQKGGVSGKAAQQHTWNYLSALKQNTDVPVIGPSVWEYGDKAGKR